MTSLLQNKPKQYEKDSLYVFLKKKGVPIEILALIKEFYEQKWQSNPTNKYPNKEDNDTGTFPFGKYKGQRYDDPTIPQTYISWVLKQDKLLTNFPLFKNSLKKHASYQQPQVASESLPQEKPELKRTKPKRTTKQLFGDDTDDDE